MFVSLTKRKKKKKRWGLNWKAASLIGDGSVGKEAIIPADI